MQFSWCDVQALMSVLDDNVVLGLCPCFKESLQPSYNERFVLLVLFLISGLFCEQIVIVTGPSCRSLYEDKCPEPFFKQDLKRPYDLLGTFERRLLEERAEEEQETGGEVDLEHPLKRGLLSVFWYFVTVNEGRAVFNCTMPMCDIFAPGTISLEEAERFTHFDVGRGAHAIRYIPGYCRCSRNVRQFLASFIPVLVLQTIVQTCLVEIYTVALTTSWDHPQLGCVGSCKHLLDIAVKTTLIILMAAMLVVILLIRPFEPKLLLLSVGAATLQVVTVQLLKSYLKCVILKNLGCCRSDTTYAALPTQDLRNNRELADAASQPDTNCCHSSGCYNRPWTNLFRYLPLQDGEKPQTVKHIAGG
eukprot:TRINITY_DN92059_c0_g1_i1.p1 TRINITY_DN92059_c0_g1~~TRINITY_DN92059_c0_g1_i1.p1  ORF type:complete len:361 (-),score=31.67 TRINITY_DN92059_c0_g1_i1:274-1356(-)